MATMYDCETRPNHDVYQEIKKYYEDAYQCIDNALKLDESGKTDEAIQMYEFSLTLLDQALNQPLESPTEPDVDWEKAYSMVQKMRKSRKEVLGRLEAAQSKQQVDATLPPPSYEEAVGTSTSGLASAPEMPGPRVQPMWPSPGIAPPQATPYLPGPSYDVMKPQANVTTTAGASGDAVAVGEGTATYAELNAALSSMRATGNREIIYSHNNVRLYFIAPDGRVSATSEPDTLVIGRIEDLTHDDILDDTLLSIVDQLRETSIENNEGRKKRHHSHHRRRRHGHRTRSDRSEPARPLSQDEAEGQIYLQVGTWVYPLIPGISPVFRSDFGAFILPDVHSDVDGASVGLILPPSADKSVYDILDSILFGVVNEQQLHPPKRPPRSRRSDAVDRKPESTLTSNILKGTNYLASSLVRGAGSASRFIDATTPRIMSRITPATDPQPVSPSVKTTVSVAKTVSGKAATVSDFLANKVGSAASALGQYLAPHIQNGGTKLLTATTKMSSEEAATKMESVLGATSGAIQGIATVYTGLEDAARILGRSLSNNTVQIIEYKYGAPTGLVTGDVLSAAGNIYDIHGNYKVLKPTKLAKVVAKSAIRASHEEFEGSGPGDGSGFKKGNDGQ